MNISDNKNKKPLLSFCIFTYNQPDAVRRVLKSLIPQASNEVEILIRDDSTNDETERIVESFSGFKNLRYFHGEKEGVDKALVFLLNEARGEYFWGFGDDDLDSMAILKVLEVIQKNPETTFIITNSREIGNVESDFRIGPSRFFKNPEEALLAFSDLLNYVSILIYKREIALAGIDDLKPFINYSCASFYMALYMLSKRGKCYFLNYPCVIPDPRNPEEKLWYDPFEIHAVNVFLVAKAFRKTFNKKALKKMTAITFRKVWRGIIVHRIKQYRNGFKLSFPRLIVLFKLYWSYPEFYIALPLFLTPRFVLRIFYKIYRFFFKSQIRRAIFREVFPNKTKVDFPGGYIPNTFLLSRIDNGPVLVIGDYMDRDYSMIKKKIGEAHLLDVVDNNIADERFFIKQSVAEQTKFPDNYFQYVVMMEVIEHVWEDKNALREIHRILSPQGRLLMSAPLFHDFADHHCHIYSPKTIAALLEHSGFAIVESQYKGLAVAIPNEIVALLALLLFPVFGSKSLLMANKFFYRLHLFFRNHKKINSIFRFKWPFLRGYGVLIAAAKTNRIIDSIQIQKDGFSLKKSGKK
jgi:glycosyltransferase involved in cell wall biosynthesis